MRMLMRVLRDLGVRRVSRVAWAEVGAGVKGLVGGFEEGGGECVQPTLRKRREASAWSRMKGLLDLALRRRRSMVLVLRKMRSTMIRVELAWN